MFNVLLAFSMLYCMYFLAIRYFRRMTGRQRLTLVKMMSYSSLLAVATISTMFIFILLK